MENKNVILFIAIVLAIFIVGYTIGSGITGRVTDLTASSTGQGHSAAEIGEGTIANTLTISNGKVGIGTTNPIENLDVMGNVNLRTNGFYRFNAENTGMISPSASTLQFQTSGEPRLHITSSGNVGIGTTNPTEKLHVAGAIKSSEFKTFKIDVMGDVNLRTGDFYRFNSENTGMTESSVSTLQLQTSGEPRIHITSWGNVGIGTISPAEKLHVNGNIKAKQFITGDITFNKDDKPVWRMFEDENGLYVESLATGMIYRLVLEEVEEK